MSTVERALAEVGYALAPLGDALSTPDGLAGFLRGFGIAPTPAEATSSHGSSAGLRQVLGELQEAIAQLGEGDEPDFGPLLAVVPEAVGAVADLAATFAAVADRLPDDFALEVFDLTLAVYLASYYETTHAVLLLLGLVEWTQVVAGSGNPDARDVDYTRARVRWDRLGALFSDPGGLAADVYGWGGADFQANALLVRLQLLAQTTGLVATIDDLDPALTTALWPEAPEIPAALRIPVWTMDDESFSAEAGLQLSGAGPSTGDDRPGLALMPYAFGTVDAEIPVTPQLAIEIDGVVDLAGGPVALLRPSGFEVSAVGPSLDPADSITIGLRRVPGPDQESIVLVDAEGLGIGAASLFAAVTLAARDGGLAFGLTGGSIGVQPTGDGFLAKVLPDGFTAPFELKVSWTARRGLRIEGGAGLVLDIPIGLELGPFTIETVHVELLLTTEGLALELAASATLELGPIHASVTKIGVRAKLLFQPGNLGPVQLDVAFRPPDGAGLSIDASVVSGGGYILNDPDHGRYAGILQLKISDIVEITAIGLVTTKMPDGTEGFSLLVILTASFPPIQLGFGFSLTGLGGILGLNRTMNLQALRNGARSGVLDSILFPQDPVGQATKVISDVESVFPVAQDRFVIGLQARIGWGSPQLVTVDLGIVIEVPLPLRIALLGRLSVVLPDADAAVVELHLDVIGTIDTGRGELSIDARLHDSRVAVFDITGDMALRVAWGATPAFLVAVGGFHPRFVPPPGFPQLERLTIALATSDNPAVRLESYFAVTSNTVQAGARLSVHAALDAGMLGLFSADAYLGFDALVTIHPFGFVIDLSGGIVICRNGTPFIGADFLLTLTGPQPLHACGYAEVHFLGTHRIPVDVTVGPAAAEAILAALDPELALLEALALLASWSAQPARDEVGVSVKETEQEELLAHPMGTLTVRQKAVPLGLRLERFGEAPLADGPRSFAVGYRIGDAPAGSADASEVRDAWALGGLVALNDDEKLSRPSFEHLVSGHTGIGAPPAAHGAARTGSTAEYETLVVDLAEQVATPVAPFVLGGEARLLWDARDAGRDERGHAGPPNAVTLTEPEYHVATVDGLAPVGAAFPSHAEARQSMAGAAGRQVVGKHEVAR